MFALISAVVAAVFALGGAFEEVHLGWLALALLSFHFVLGEWSPWRR